MDNLEKFGYEQKLKRVLPFRDVLIYGMIFMVPIAPMGIYGFVAPDAANMVPLVYVIGICAMIFTALSYYHMSQRFPIAGSVYAYVQRALNPHIGFIAGWILLMDYILIPALLYAMAGLWCASLTPEIDAWIWVSAFIFINTFINVIGVEFTARSNIIMLVIELVALAIFMVVGLVFVLKGGGMGALSWDPIFQPDKISPHFLAAAASIAVLSFLGFDAISTLAEETTNAEKTIGRATVAALLLVGGLFVLQTYVAALVAPDIAKLNPETAFFEIAGIAGGDWLKYLLTTVNILAFGIANTMAAQASISRILFSMSRDKVIPGIFSVVHPTFKTPWVATIFVALFSILVLSITGLRIEILSKFVNFGALTSFIILNFSVFWFFFVKEKRGGLHGIINYVLCPLLGASIIGFVWWGFDLVTLEVGFAWMLIGIIWGAIASAGYRKLPMTFAPAR